jgi:hypothetical protein
MAQKNKKTDSSLLYQIAVPVLVALIVGGSAPWWIARWLSKDGEPPSSPSKIVEGSTVLRDGFKFFEESAFLFSSGSIVPWNARADIGVSRPPEASAPMFFVPFDVVYQHPEWDRGAAAAITEVVASELAQVMECPATGYRHHYVPVRLGAIYCLRLRDGKHYAALKVTDLSDDRIGFDYKFQPNQARRF